MYSKTSFLWVFWGWLRWMGRGGDGCCGQQERQEQKPSSILWPPSCNPASRAERSAKSYRMSHKKNLTKKIMILQSGCSLFFKVELWLNININLAKKKAIKKLTKISLLVNFSASAFELLRKFNLTNFMDENVCLAKFKSSTVSGTPCIRHTFEGRGGERENLWHAAQLVWRGVDAGKG